MKDEIVVYGRHGGSFPRNLYESDPIQNGIRKLYIMRDDEKEPAHGKAFEYTHFNSYGMYLYKQDIGDLEEQSVIKPDRSEGKIKIKKINFYWLSSILHQFSASAILFYQKLGYWGSVQIAIELTNALGVRMPHPLKHQVFLRDSEDLLVPNDHLKWEKIIPFTVFKEQTQDVVVEIVDVMAWSLGIRYFTEERIRKNLEDNFGQ